MRRLKTLMLRRAEGTTLRSPKNQQKMQYLSLVAQHADTHREEGNDLLCLPEC